MKKVIRHTVFLINFLLALGLVATYFVPDYNPEQHWLPSIWGYAFPYLLVANVVFVFLWVTFYWRYAFLSIICIFSGVDTMNNYFGFRPRTTDQEGINVLSYNVAHFYSYLENDESGYSVLDFIAAQHAHIICLQETKLQKKGDLNPLKLKAQFPGIVHCQLGHTSEWNGPVTFSSFPIVKMNEIRFENTNNMVLITDVKTDIDTIRIFNCHLQSFGIREDEYGVVDSIRFKSEEIEQVRKLGSKLKMGNIRRSEQVQELLKQIELCPYPIILCGDFNDIPISFTYKSISSVLADSFVESGKGVSTTYRGKLPPFRIDYIFYSDEFEAYNYQKHNVDYSDHYPISTKLLRK